MTEHFVTLTEPACRELLRGLGAGPDRTAFLAAGTCRLPERLEWLGHAVRWSPPQDTNAPFVMAVGDGDPAHLRSRLTAAQAEWRSDAPAALLALGVGRAAGHVAGVCRVAGSTRPLDSIRIVGPGLPCVALHDTPDGNAPLPEAERTAWSRTIGALGEGAWRRLRSLHVAVIGCGRSGSVAAAALCRLGLRRLTLIDGDRLEPHNLGEMDAVMPADLGRLKVDAVADTLRFGAVGDCRVDAVGESVLALPALPAAKRADVLICCVDNPGARLAAACVAALYLKPLLDIGAGIFREGGGRRMGADLRLLLPDRCLLCLGGVGDLERTRRELLTDPTLAPPAADWRGQRAGSLHSLNAVAVHLGLLLLEDLAAGRLTESTWLHLEVSPAGIPVLEQRPPTVASACRLCRLIGRGDDGVPAIRGALVP